MKNFVQPGKVVTAIAPNGGVNSGQLVVIGTMFGVAAGKALSGAEVELQMGGVFDLPKTTGASMSIAAGAVVYWDNTGKAATNSATSNTKIGVSLIATANADATIRVRLNDSF